MPKTSDELKEDIIWSETVLGQEMTFHSTWGLFSPKAVDNGSHRLLHAVKTTQAKDILDLCCGYGPIGLTLAKAKPDALFHLVDKDFVAVEMAKTNAEANELNNTEVYLSNAFSHVEKTDFDLILSNIPAKVGKELLYIIIADAKKHLKPGGQLVVVTIKSLAPFIKREMEAVFGNYERLDQKEQYTISLTTREEE